METQRHMTRMAGSAASLLLALLPAACSSSPAPVVSCRMPGGPVSGAKDTHCGSRVQPTSFGACHPEAGTVPDSAYLDAALGPDGGFVCTAYGPTMWNTEGDDDDCKYHVKWSVSTVCENAGVYFTVTATHKTDGSPLTGAHPYPEVFLDPTHPGDSSKSAAVEGPPGTYKVGPVYFDASGIWTVRFHFDEQCADLLPESPHGHAAFYLRVP